MTRIDYVDSHCHFDFPEFDLDREDLWRRCQASGVSMMLVPGVAPDCWSRAQACSLQLRDVYFAVGLHPWWIKGFVDSEREPVDKILEGMSADIETFVRCDHCRAIGECGLDKTIDVDMDIQIAILEQHLAWSKNWSLPLVLHCQGAHAELIRVLKKSRPNNGGMVHAFTGSSELAREYVKLGFCLGAGGAITYPRAKKTRKAFLNLPREAILLETDAPSMPLNGKQGRRNSPECLPEIAQALAQLRAEELADLASYTSQNFSRVFL